MIKRKLNQSRIMAEQTKAIDTIAEVSIGDVTTPVVKSGGLNIITTTDLENNPVITEAQVMSMPDQTKPTEEQTTETGGTLTSGETVQPTEAPKKPFPWWLLLVGAGIIYVITRKK